MAAERDREEALFEQINWVVFLAVGLLILILSILYVVIIVFGPKQDGLWFAFLSLCLSVFPNLISSAVLFLAVYISYREIQEMRTEREHEALAETLSSRLVPVLKEGSLVGREPTTQLVDNVRGVPWAKLIAGSSTVDICVHFWERWITDNAQTFQDLFDHGGTVRLALPNPTHEGLISTIKSRFPDMDEDSIVKSIRETPNRLAHLVRQSNHKRAKVEIFFVDKLMWYCGVRCDHRYLVLSFYEHSRLFRTESPSFVIDLNSHPVAESWFEREFSDLMDNAAHRDVVPEPQKA